MKDKQKKGNCIMGNYTKKFLINNRGITLITLVTTIIVLLILGFQFGF